MRPYTIRLITCFTAMAAICLCDACAEKMQDCTCLARLSMDCRAADTRSGIVEENTIWDVNVFVVGCEGILEQHRFVRYDGGRQAGADMDISLLSGREYTIFAFANAGYDMGNMDEQELQDFRFYLQRPDMASSGIPMSGKVQFSAAEGDGVRLELKRLASRVTVVLDRSRLDDNVDFHIAGVRVGNCPRWVQAYSPSAILSRDDCFPAGYYSRGDDRTELYLLENLQGSANPDLCSYVELDIDYASDKFYTDGRNGLIYRFYLREGASYMVQRNCHYTVTVCPEKDGLLCDDSWRVDKSRLIPVSGDAFLKISPSGSTVDGVFYDHYYEMDRGGSLHFDLAYSPAYMTVGLRQDLVDDELEDGRASYVMDADGHGFTVRSIGGSGLSMMEIVAGEPLNGSQTIAVYIE
ncbi:MAG: FimB/Mfa2 family fimbrial subunit [Bacteroidales bacterium]|nr:FimB/Mfa2 family fimbrial subunit [Bacteroidales bacterium]